MPDGNLRRPPQPWESRLARISSVAGGPGISGSGDGTSIVVGNPTPGAGGGTEPAPVLPDPGSFIKPSTPTLIGQVQGISVIWDGLNSAGELWPSDTSWVDIHMSTSGTAFTPGTATLKGRLTRAGAYSIGGLTAGSTYYFKLQGADPAGNYTEPSNAASGSPGLTTSGDYGTATVGQGAISFNARQIGGVTNTVSSSAPSSPLTGDVWLDSSPGTAIIHKIWNGSSWVTNAWGSASIAAGQITALQIAAGAVTAGAIAAGEITTDKLKAGTITGFHIASSTVASGLITGGTVSGGFITGGTISTGYLSGGTVNAAIIRTSDTGSRIVLNDAVGGVDSLSFFNSSGARVSYLQPTSTGLLVNGTAAINGEINSVTVLGCERVSAASNAVVYTGYRTTTTAADIMLQLKSNVTNTNESKFEVESDGDVKSRTNSYAGFSDARFKENIIPARNYLDDLRQVDVVTFNWIGSDQKLLGVTAQQLQPIFPSMVAEDADGTLSVRYSVFVPMLITAVQSLAAQVDALTARIEALEG